jgi:hypothetical protein
MLPFHIAAFFPLLHTVSVTLKGVIGAEFKVNAKEALISQLHHPPK